MIRGDKYMMDNNYSVGFCVINTLCLIVIAVSVHRLASDSYSYYGNYDTLNGPGMLSNSSNPRYSGSRSDFDNGEPPVFWNMGSVDEVNDLLQSASHQTENDAAVYAANVAMQAQAASAAAKGKGHFGNRSFATNAVKLEDKLLAAGVGL